MIRVILLAALLLPTLSLAQANSPEIASSWVPRPMLFGGLSLYGNGYQTVAGNVGGGLLLNHNKLIGDLEAFYANATKVNDGTGNNPKGHERFLRGRLFYPFSRALYAGGGVQWSETSTTNYTNKYWRPTVGVGGDHFGESWSCRWQGMYIFPGTDHLHALQGPEIQFWLPSPASNRHFFFRETLGIYEFHQTTTSSAPKQRDVAAFLDFDFGWRF